MTQREYGLQQIFGLDGAVVLVTGAGGRLGGEIASACLAAGADVVAIDSDKTALAAKADEKGWPGAAVETAVVDVRDAAQVEDVLAGGERRFGDVNALVNCAGVNVFAPFLERTEEDFDFVTDVNLKGPFFCTRAFVALRKRRGGSGAIVNIASVYGLVSPDPRIYPDNWQRHAAEAYCASKSGLIGMTRYFAAFCAPDGIRVNAVAPGGIRNPYVPQPEEFRRNYGDRCPLGRMGEVDEIPGSVVFLLSPSAGYVTGQVLAIDGGLTAW